MTGIFTYRHFALGNIPALNGRVAVVTGGQAGIGKGKHKITTQLLLHDIEKVIIIARSEDKYITACEEWRHRKGISLENDTRAEFVKCDLGDIQDVKAAVEKIKQITDRIHILVCNAAISVQNECKHSPQKIERVFATNCVGHQVLTTSLLPLLKNGVTPSNDARIVVTSSSFHFWCQQLDLDLLFSLSRVKWPALYDGIWRYGRSKLGNILFAKELSRRLLDDEDPASKQIYVNSFFPGNIVTDQWLGWDSYFGKFVGWLIRAAGSWLGQSLEDGAATALYLATSQEVREQNHRAQYFIPIATLCAPSAISRDMKLARELWDWIDAQATETLGLDWQYQ
ncbi:Short-chain dehydrogenase/reductase SDR [Penicillium camemberti]|uniref:Short-chain dehydrogenase/reductase SDR n=1 Tax=Penicillium camemberti (strain FM 013) TaxID=1429867 RepID=A0A0G4PFP3_PENC3|nr:Short-chain dehydrogenase/reductase SDR [Penicillium camemberti]